MQAVLAGGGPCPADAQGCRHGCGPPGGDAHADAGADAAGGAACRHRCPDVSGACRIPVHFPGSRSGQGCASGCAPAKQGCGAQTQIGQSCATLPHCQHSGEMNLCRRQEHAHQNLVRKREEQGQLLSSIASDHPAEAASSPRAFSASWQGCCTLVPAVSLTSSSSIACASRDPPAFACSPSGSKQAAAAGLGGAQQAQQEQEQQQALSERSPSLQETISTASRTSEASASGQLESVEAALVWQHEQQVVCVVYAAQCSE